ncbi:MAG: hypothetical protein ACRDNZ_07385 [Streptosporangiaceae bacterium]
MGRKNRRLLVPGDNSRPAGVRVLASALGPGKPRERDLLSAYRSRLFEMPDHGNEGGRMYIGRSGNRLVQIGVDVDTSDLSGDVQIIYHGQWKGGQ